MSEKINIIIAAQTNSAVKGLDQVSKSTQRVGQSVQNAQARPPTWEPPMRLVELAAIHLMKT